MDSIKFLFINLALLRLSLYLYNKIIRLKIQSKNKIKNKLKELIKIIEVHPNKTKLKKIFEIKTMAANIIKKNILKIDIKKILTAITSAKRDKDIKPCSRCL